MTDARDENGHYCGQRVSDGKFQCSPPDKVGYCGPACGHCIQWPVYAIQDGVYCCAADWDYERRSERQALLPWPTGQIKQADCAHNNNERGSAMPVIDEPVSTSTISFSRATTRRITEDDVRRIVREELVAATEVVPGDRVAVTFTGTVVNRAPGFLVEIARDNDPKTLWFYDYESAGGVSLSRLEHRDRPDAEHLQL